MMILIQNRSKITSLRAVAACAGLVLFLAGCGVQDAALVLPAGEGRKSSVGNFGVDEFGTDETVSSIGANAERRDSAGKESAEPGESQAAEESPRIYVYVCGAVMEPGVVELAEGSRAEDALRAAGGFAEDAQRDYVNLAAKVNDGEKLYFPDVTQAETLEAEESAGVSGLVNINTAGAAELCMLPGIGEARAQDIISYREAHGAFQSKEDIMKVPGIKTAAYEKLCDKITVN